MPTLSEYFRTEAQEFLRTIDRLVAAGRPDAHALHRATRGLRGSAQMAREERFYRAVSAFENVTRSLAAGALGWSEDMTERARATIADLREMLDRVDTDELEARAANVTERWQEKSLAARAAVAPAANGGDEFRQFAGREVAEIADVLDQSIVTLQTDPMDREPLRAVLRRQRALLGAARLDEIPVVAEILRAIEDLTRVVAKLDVGVKKEWLDIYRVARDGLQATIAALLRGENPEPSHAVSRLRHMRAELLERYGEGETVSAAHDEGLVQAQPMFAGPAVSTHLPPPPPRDEEVFELGSADIVPDETDDVLELDDAAMVADDGVLELSDVVDSDDDAGPEPDMGDEGPILELEDADTVYDDAVLELESSQILEPDTPPLERALQLRAVIARATTHDPDATAAVDELLDLLRSALE